MIYIRIFILAAALYIFLRSVSALFRLLTGKRKLRYIFLRVFPVVEIILWISFAFWVSHQLFSESDIYPLLTGSMIVVLTAIFGWYFLRDFITGIILKAENAFEPGQIVLTSLASGKIKKLGYRSMEIETEAGECIKVPYSLLSNRKLIRPPEKSKGVSRMIQLRIPSKHGADDIQSMLRRRIMEMPWIITGEDINIKIAREEADFYEVELSFHSLGDEMAMKTEESLKRFVGEVFGD